MGDGTYVLPQNERWDNGQATTIHKLLARMAKLQASIQSSWSPKCEALQRCAIGTIGPAISALGVFGCEGEVVKESRDEGFALSQGEDASGASSVALAERQKGHLINWLASHEARMVKVAGVFPDSRIVVDRENGHCDSGSRGDLNTRACLKTQLCTI